MLQRWGGWCGSPFAHERAHLLAVCRTRMGYGYGGSCGAPFVHGCEQLCSASGTWMGSRQGGWCGAVLAHRGGHLLAVCRMRMGYRYGGFFRACKSLLARLVVCQSRLVQPLFYRSAASRVSNPFLTWTTRRSLLAGTWPWLVPGCPFRDQPSAPQGTVLWRSLCLWLWEAPCKPGMGSGQGCLICPAAC